MHSMYVCVCVCLYYVCPELWLAASACPPARPPACLPARTYARIDHSTATAVPRRATYLQSITKRTLPHPMLHMYAVCNMQDASLLLRPPSALPLSHRKRGTPPPPLLHRKGADVTMLIRWGYVCPQPRPSIPNLHPLRPSRGVDLRRYPSCRFFIYLFFSKKKKEVSSEAAGGGEWFCGFATKNVSSRVACATNSSSWGGGGGFRD